MRFRLKVKPVPFCPLAPQGRGLASPLWPRWVCRCSRAPGLCSGTAASCPAAAAAAPPAAAAAAATPGTPAPAAAAAAAAPPAAAPRSASSCTPAHQTGGAGVHAVSAAVTSPGRLTNQNNTKHLFSLGFFLFLNRLTARGRPFLITEVSSAFRSVPGGDEECVTSSRACSCRSCCCRISSCLCSSSSCLRMYS